MKIKHIITVLASITILTCLSACGQKSQPSQDIAAVFPGTKEKDMVVLDVTSEPLQLNSMRVYDAVSTDVLAHCMSGLTKLDAKDRAVADLAESWEISEDNQVYTMYLRKDAKWSNGDSVTAHDYYFSWVTQLKPEEGSVFVSFLLDNLKGAKDFYEGRGDESQLGIQVIDDYTLRIEWDRPMTDGLFLLSLPTYLPVNQKAYEAIGEERYGKDADQMVTNGAYKLSTWVHDDHIILEKSEDYYDASSIHIPKVKLVMIGDSNTRLNAFMAGEIDLSNLYGEQIEQVKAKDEGAIASYFDGGSWYLSFNTRNPQLVNVNLRKALAYSIDVQSLLDHVIADGSIVADGLVPHTIGGVGEESYAAARGSLFAYDLELAKASMDQAMAELGMQPSDLKLTLDVVNTTYNENQAAYIQEQWKQNLGIEVTVNTQPWGALQEAKWNGDFDIGVEGNGASENSAMGFLTMFTSDNSNNITGYESEVYDQLINNANQEEDPVKKQEQMIQGETMLLDEMIIGPLYYTCTTYAVSDKVKGLVRTPFQVFSVLQGATINEN